MTMFSTKRRPINPNIVNNLYYPPVSSRSSANGRAGSLSSASSSQLEELYNQQQVSKGLPTVALTTHRHTHDSTYLESLHSEQQQKYQPPQQKSAQMSYRPPAQQQHQPVIVAKSSVNEVPVSSKKPKKEVKMLPVVATINPKPNASTSSFNKPKMMSKSMEEPPSPPPRIKQTFMTASNIKRPANGSIRSENTQFSSESTLDMSSTSDGKVRKRKLWWNKDPNAVKHIEIINQPVRVTHVTPRIDHINANWSPKQSEKKIVNQKLEWNKDGKIGIDTWSNADHQPLGGQVKIHSERLEWNAEPKTDCGFVYYYE